MIFHDLMTWLSLLYMAFHPPGGRTGLIPKIEKTFPRGQALTHKSLSSLCFRHISSVSIEQSKSHGHV